MAKKLKPLSIYLSYLLRHGPDDLGLDMDQEGWVDTAELIRRINQQGRYTLTAEHLAQIVAQDQKGRYRFSQDGTRIKACQGHSVPWVQPKLEYLPPPTYLYHGTTTEALGEILASGAVKRMNRHAVHMQAEVEKAWASANRRKGKQGVVLQIAAGEMAAKGFTFGRTENQVWCCEEIPVAYIEKVLNRQQADDITPHIWNQENLQTYRDSLKELPELPQTRKLFYVNPKGNLKDHEMLLALSVNYQARNVSEEVLVNSLLAFETPLTRMEFMCEQEPGSGEFHHATCDLLARIMERKDTALLRRIYEAIEPHRRSEVDALLEQEDV